jgi:molybdate transport system substrate-binding protein
MLRSLLCAALVAFTSGVLAPATPALAQPRQVTVATPGFMNNGGLDIITKGFEAETGIKVNLKYGGMEQVMGYALDGTADAVFLPVDYMNQVAAKEGIKAGTRKRVGRSYQGLAVRKGSKIPDISTKEKFVAALESANLVLHSRCQGPTGGPGCSQTAYMISSLFDRPEMAKVKHAPSPYGEGGDALARNEGDMAIQNISQILKWDNLAVVGPVPEEFGLYLDGVAAVPSRAKDAALGQQFIDYATQKGTFSIWWSRGVDPRKGGN